ncbi:MAG: ribosome biogenesis protein [Thaumarchaeota archaeon]|nr:MAG: ribosome biogenesis protein [Nitrososphaerota archaeon]
MYSLVIAEAAIEIIPPILRNHPSVKNHSKRVGRNSNELLLDISYHHKAMVEQNLQEWWKRGRPDIVHFDLLESLSTPLSMQKKLQVYVSTFDNKLITINQNLRIPKNYFRFEGLITSIFLGQNKKNSPKLIELKENVGFNDLIEKIIRPDLLIGFSIQGTKTKIKDILVHNITNDSRNYCFVIGGFQRGHFSERISRTFNNLFSISPYSLESHVVIARVLYECENYA